MLFLLQVRTTKRQDGVECEEPSLVGLRDRALIGAMVYTFARVNAVLKMKVRDYFVQGRRGWVRLHEKGGKEHEVPCHHNLERYLDEYIAAAGIAEDPDAPLFQTAAGRTGQLTGNALWQQDAYRMIQRRAKTAGIQTRIGNHTFRATGITAYLKNSGTLETAQHIANHESPRTTKLYDRRQERFRWTKWNGSPFNRFDGMIPLEEQSKGFQWFFSFDLHFMHDSEATFEGCVLLLDEPGLHLHPGGQKDLLERLDAYAKKNTLIYTTHLPFLVDLREPKRIKVIKQTELGAIVSDDLGGSQTDERLTLQAALGMSANQSYLVSKRNLLVEGVHDYWIITELSNIFEREERVCLPDDVLITAAGGASEIVPTATFMIGQELSIVALFDSDSAGRVAEGKLREKWITRLLTSKISYRLCFIAHQGTVEGFCLTRNRNLFFFLGPQIRPGGAPPNHSSLSWSFAI